ncbi:hypothetical protein GGS24DRAFT_99890 [Hypoxylon argillaceum]|nr:hypothetical protein GGS24DRAFT_99890 [Hypoxylon argillaceum]
MNHGTRFTELRQLILGGNGFSREEIRYLKLLLCDINTDLIGELPLEIVTIIALHLQPEDFACCLSVSKVWREQFLSGPVMGAYARHRWPALIDGAVNRHNFLSTLSKFGWITYRFRQIDDRDDPENVSLSSKTTYQLDPVVHQRADDIPAPYKYSIFLENTYIVEFFYASGKMAWNLPSCVVVIDDLRSRTRKVFTPPSGVTYGLFIKLQTLGSRLLVGTIDRLLVAWDHVDNQKYEKSLPCRALRCVSQRDRVAIILYGGLVMLWTPGHAVLQLNTAPLILELGITDAEAKTWRSCLSVSFDARDSKALYLASAYFFRVTTKMMIRLTVHEFSTLSHIATWSFDCEDPNSNSKDGPPLPNRYEYGLPIVISEFEFGRSAIFFHWQDKLKEKRYLAVFDKLQKKFIDFEPSDWWYWSENFKKGPNNERLKFRRRFPLFGFSEDGGMDLDFITILAPGQPGGYDVWRSKLLQDPA